MSQQNVPDWMPLYVYEFIADRNVQAMELDELGAYFRLILTQWVNGSVPEDIRALARLLHRDVETMERIWEALKGCYRPHPELAGELVQGRVEEERAVALARLAGSSKGGTVRAQKVREKKLRRGKKSAAEGTPVLEGWPAEGPAQPTAVSPATSVWEEFKRLYPAHRLDEENACRALLSREEEAADIVSGLRVAVTCGDWLKEEGRFVPKASNFISTGLYKDHLRAVPAAKKTAFFDPSSITGGKN